MPIDTTAQMSRMAQGMDCKELKYAELMVVVQCESPKRETISSAVQICSVTPAAIAGVLR